MASPSVEVGILEQAVFVPQDSEAIFGLVGPATRGPIDELNDFTDVGSFVAKHGEPPNARYFAPAGCIRYLERGSSLKFSRLAGVNLATATVMLQSVGDVDILQIRAAGENKAGLLVDSPGTWANNNLRVTCIHNGVANYEIQVYFKNMLVERHIALTNGIIETVINSGSRRSEYIRVALQPGAGVTFPAETRNQITNAFDRIPLADGDDGALAKTKSVASSTSGAAGHRFHGGMHSTSGSRTWETILDITAGLAGKAVIRGSIDMPILPGTFTIRVQNGGGPTYIELADDGDESYAVGGAGVGLLIPASGNHRGFVDYRTGSWGVSLDATTTHSGGVVQAIWVRANSESVGSTVEGEGAYAGNLSSGAAPGFFNANKATFFVSVDEQVGETPATSPAGAASSNADLKTLAGWIVPGTVVLTPSHSSSPVPPAIYDDGFGGWRTGPGGTGVAVTGSVNYRTGVWTVTTWDPVGAVTFPATAAQIRGQYDIQLFNMGGGAVPGETGLFVDDEVLQPSDAGGDATAASGDAGAQVIVGPIFPGAVKLVCSDVAGSPVTIYDNGVGGWLDRPRGDPRAVAVTGSVTYATGAWTVTFGASINAGASVIVDYVRSVEEQGRRALRGMGPQFRANSTANAAGMNLDDPAEVNEWNGTNFLDHVTGAFGIELDLVTTTARTFDLKDNGTITAVYTPATILGWGDGTEVVFDGTVTGAPFRREDGRLMAFQAAQASAAGAGEAQVALAEAGTVIETDDGWTLNVALITDDDNYLIFSTGETSIQWTSAPLLDEAVFVVAEDIVLHLTARWPGDIGNERSTLTEGMYAILDEDPTVTGTYRLRVLYDSVEQESFGQAVTLDELVNKINDSVNGSDLVTAELVSGLLPPDVSAAQNLGLSGAFTSAQVIGTKTGSVYTGIQHFRNNERVTVDFVLIPGQWHRQIITAQQELVERQDRNAVGIIPMPDYGDIFDHRDFLNGDATESVLVPFPPQAAINSYKMVAAPTGWVENFDQYNNVYAYAPADAEVARLLAITPQPWFPAAGFRRGQVVASQLRYSPEKEDRDLCMGLVGSTVEVVNPIIEQTGRGLFLIGQQTTYRTPGSALSQLSTVWTLHLIARNLHLTLQDMLLELNDPVTWRQATNRGNAILRPIIEERGLLDGRVLFDGTTTTPADVDAGRMRGKLFLQVARPILKIRADLIIVPTGVSFENIVG